MEKVLLGALYTNIPVCCGKKNLPISYSLYKFCMDGTVAVLEYCLLSRFNVFAPVKGLVVNKIPDTKFDVVLPVLK